MKIGFNYDATRKHDLDIELDPLIIRMDLYVSGNTNIIVSRIEDGTSVLLDTAHNKCFKVNNLYMTEVPEWIEFCKVAINDSVKEADKGRGILFPQIISSYDGRFESSSGILIPLSDKDEKILDQQRDPAYTLTRKVYSDTNSALRSMKDFSNSLFIREYLEKEFINYGANNLFIIDDFRKYYDDLKVVIKRFYVCPEQSFSNGMKDSVLLVSRIEYKAPEDREDHQINLYYNCILPKYRRQLEIKTTETIYDGNDKYEIKCTFSNEQGNDQTKYVNADHVSICRKYTTREDDISIIGYYDMKEEDLHDVFSLNGIKSYMDYISEDVCRKFLKGIKTSIPDFPNTVQIITRDDINASNLIFMTRMDSGKRFTSIRLTADPYSHILSGKIYGENIEELEKENDIRIENINIISRKYNTIQIKNADIIIHDGIEIINKEFYQFIEATMEDIRKKLINPIKIFLGIGKDQELKKFIKKEFLPDFDQVYNIYMKQLEEFDSLFKEYESRILNHTIE